MLSSKTFGFTPQRRIYTYKHINNKNAPRGDHARASHVHVLFLSPVLLLDDAIVVGIFTGSENAVLDWKKSIELQKE